MICPCGCLQPVKRGRRYAKSGCVNRLRTPTSKVRAAASRGRVSSPSPSGNGATGVNSEESARETTAFEKFWDAYPRKEGKGAAEKAFAKQSGHLDAMLLALTVQRQSRQWLDSGGQFIPHPSTWLNQRRWEDSGVDVPTPKVVPDWRAECDRVHGGTNGSFCGNGFMHAARMKDATEDIKGDA